MRNNAYIPEIDTLYVLGAGASYDASVSTSERRQAPLDKDFVRRLCQLSPSRPNWVAPARERLVSQWKDHRRFDDFGLEEAVLRQLGNLEFISAVHPRRSKNAITAFEWLSLASHLMCFTLRDCRESTAQTYLRFSDIVFPHEDADANRNRVITFNYDDLLDRHLVKRFGVQQVYFDKIKSRRSDSDRRNRTYHDPLVVKLHGSVNWRCEEDEFEGILENSFADPPHRIPSIWYAANGTPEPDDDEYPLLIPPLPSKPLSSIKLFQYLWTRAYEYLHTCQHLVVCGYSLPPTDTLAWSLFSGFRNSRLKTVTIVDPNPSIISTWQKLLRRKNVTEAEFRYYEGFGGYVRALRL